MQEKLYSMKKELAELLGRDRLLKSAVKEVNKLDMIKASMVIRYRQDFRRGAEEGSGTWRLCVY